jgi:MscS family membrane protein
MVATIVLALVWGSVLAAEQATTENVAASPKYEVPEDEFGRGSPRGTVKGYLAACREGDYEKAANYLDLRRIPRDGPTLARQLRIILSRTLWVDVDVLNQEHAGRSNDGLPPYRVIGSAASTPRRARWTSSYSVSPEKMGSPFG